MRTLCRKLPIGAATLALLVCAQASLQAATYNLQWAVTHTDKPTKVAVDVSGNVFVGVVGSEGYLQKLNYNGVEVVRATGFPANNAGATGVAVDSAGNVWANDRNGDYRYDPNKSNIRKYTNNLSLILSAASGASGVIEKGDTFYAYGAAVDSSNNLYVPDTNGDFNIMKFDSSGNFLGELASGALKYPYGIDVDAAGNIYAIYFDNPNSVFGVKKFSSAGVELAFFGGYAPFGNPWYKPYDVAVDSGGNIYVAAHHGLYKYNSAGTLLQTIGSNARATGVAVHPLGHVYVSSEYNSYVKMYALEGAPLPWLLIPEPGSGLLVVLGAGAAAILRRRR